MSTLLSALNPSAGAAASRAAARAGAAGDKAADRDGAGSPFADLLGASPAEGKAAQPAQSDGGDRNSDDKVDSARQDRDRDDDRAARAADAVPTLPAWLQALREPAPQAAAAAVANEVVAPADGDAAAALAALTSSFGASRSLKAEAALAPSSASSAPADVGVFASALAAADAADPATALPTPEPLLVDADAALGAAQNLALGNALDSLASKTDLPVSLVATLGVDRSTSTITTAPTAVDAGSLLAAGQAQSQAQSQAQALDAYGEPLSLDGPDAAIRLGERLRWLSEAGVQEARLQLHPKELGAIDIRIRVEHQTASVWFGADHPAARAALEATLPQLRERLAADGLQLGQAEVGSQSQSPAQGQSNRQGSAGEGQSGAQLRGRAPGDSDERAAAVPASERLAAVVRHRGLVDRYA